MGTGSFLDVKRTGRGADHPPLSKRRGHERVELYLYSPSGPSWPVIEPTFTFTLPYLSRTKKHKIIPAHFILDLHTDTFNCSHDTAWNNTTIGK